MVFWKLLLMIISLGATTCTLLVMRQQRLDLLSAQTLVKERIIEQGHAMRSVRYRLEQELNEQELHDWIERSGLDFQGIPFEIRFDEELQLPRDLALEQSEIDSDVTR